MSRQPTVVIVGRPNVGKSTLFNRLTGSRRALVHDLPGVTRDRIIAEAHWPGGDRVTVVDTGGLLLGSDDHYVALIRSQAKSALQDGDVVLFLVDGLSGPVPEDREIAGLLRSLDLPSVVVVNKGDRAGVELNAQEFFGLGLGDPVLISAEHGTGISELWDTIRPLVPGSESDAADDPDRDTASPSGEVQVAFIGRPNVGKSSLLNRLAGEPRVLVSERPGTTRDAVDVLVERDQQRFRFVDTAGIRRKGRTDRGPEVLSVVMARRHLERAHLCLFLLDASQELSRQDAHVAGLAWEAGRAVAVVANKMDLIAEPGRRRQQLEDQAGQHLKFLRHAPWAFLSALTGKGVPRLFGLMQNLHQAFSIRVSTSEVNRILRPAWERRPPPMAGKKAPKLYYASQFRNGPPGFVLLTNLSREPHFSYLRYLENILRETLDLAGVPIRVIIRERRH